LVLIGRVVTSICVMRAARAREENGGGEALRLDGDVSLELDESSGLRTMSAYGGNLSI
jgi:hypothetical protein